MIPAEILRKKRDGAELSSDEINAFINGLIQGNVTLTQGAAFLMAVCIRGLVRTEIVALTHAMAQSGTCYNWRHLGYAVDKHSTGGVGDKLSLLVAPIAAAAGALIPMMSGRGLGHSGGTVDKLESIVGFRVSMTDEEIEQQLRSLGVVMLAQSERLAPADRILYALRDETGTVESVGLITASILSKKIAEGTRGLVLDVKVGRGAFMQRHEDAQELAMMLRDVGKDAGLDISIALTDMNAPLGYAVGNWVEVLEAERCLAHPAECPPDIEELTLHLVSAMLQLAGIVPSHRDGVDRARTVWLLGLAWQRFHEMIAHKVETGRRHTNDISAHHRLSSKARGQATSPVLIRGRLGLLRSNLERAVFVQVTLLILRQASSSMSVVGIGLNLGCHWQRSSHVIKSDFPIVLTKCDMQLR